jgi:hypothetical protein
MPDLTAKNPAVTEAAPWSGGIETNQHDIADAQDRIEIGPDDFAIKDVWLEKALEDPPQRHVVIARNHEHREIRQAVEELSGFLELVTLGPLCQIAAHHDGIGGKRRDGSQQGLRDRRDEWRPEMQIGYVEDPG